MANQNSKRRSRKRRNPGSVPRAVPSQRRNQRTEHRASTAPQRRPARGPTGTYGERPQSPFGGLPISEIAIFVGAIGLIVGLINGGQAALFAGVAVCTLGVVEITAREHFSGYRSHTILLAALPAVLAEVAFVAIVGEPNPRLLLLLVIVPVFSAIFWILRKRFLIARQARVARPPTA